MLIHSVRWTYWRICHFLSFYIIVTIVALVLVINTCFSPWTRPYRHDEKPRHEPQQRTRAMTAAGTMIKALFPVLHSSFSLNFVAFIICVTIKSTGLTSLCYIFHWNSVSLPSSNIQNRDANFTGGVFIVWSAFAALSPPPDTLSSPIEQPGLAKSNMWNRQAQRRPQINQRGFRPTSSLMSWVQNMSKPHVGPEPEWEEEEEMRRRWQRQIGLCQRGYGAGC